MTKIGRRDRWQCHLCHLPVPKKGYTLNSPQAPSIDHVTPVTRGGRDVQTNLRLAHRRCNELRGDRLLSELPPGEFDDVWK